MIFFQVPSGGDRNFGYLVGCEKTGLGAVIDPSPDPQFCYDKARENNLEVVYVINTHTHYDHTGGNEFFKSRTRAQLITHRAGLSGDIQVNDLETLSMGEVDFTFYHTPGHTPDSICILAGKEMMTGDTLFVGKVGGTSTRETAALEFDSLKKLMALESSIRVWPGHDYGLKPSSTIAQELESNPFIRRLNNFEDFMWLKTNWAAYKVEHGIP